MSNYDDQDTGNEEARGMMSELADLLRDAREALGEDGTTPSREALDFVADSLTEAEEKVNALEAELAEAREALRRIHALVDEQAEDEGLWALYPVGQQPIAEAYLQQELRRLHALVEAAAHALSRLDAEEQT